MRAFELLLVAPVAIGLVAWAARGRRWSLDVLRGAAGLAVLILVVHVIWRAAAGRCCPPTSWPASSRSKHWSASAGGRSARRRRSQRPGVGEVARRCAGGAITLGAVALVLAAALPALFPVDILPAPTGPYRVGTATLHLNDPSRREPFTAAADDARAFTVTAWYSANQNAEGERTRLWGEPGLVARELAGGIGLPSFALSHLALTPAHARSGVPAAARGASFPVLLFSHGYAQSFAAQNSALLEDLASHGYVVLSIAHPYEGLVTRDRSDRLVRADLAQTKRLSDEVGGVFPLIERAAKATDPAEADRLMREALAKTPVVDRSLALWAGDLRFVLAAFPEVERQVPALRGALDASRVGMVGMSFGAAAAVQACADEPACDAAVNLDGAQFGRIVETGTTKPVLYLTSGSPAPGVNLPAYRCSGEGSAYASVKGATHLDFSDLALISPVFRWIGALGAIGGEQMTAIERDAVRGFVDAHLLGGRTFDAGGLVRAYPEFQPIHEGAPTS